MMFYYFIGFDIFYAYHGKSGIEVNSSASLAVNRPCLTDN